MCELVCSFRKDNAKTYQFPLHYFSFSLCCPFIWIWEWNRTGNWRFPVSAMSQSSSFLIMVSIRPSHFDFSPTGTGTWRSWCVCSFHTNMESRCSWGVGAWKRLWNPQFRCNISCSKLWLQQEEWHHTCQDASSPHIIVVPWFGVPLCHCTVVMARLRTSHVN